MFITHTFIDFIYQFTNCRGHDVSNIKIIKNCLLNSLYVSLAISIGYITAIFFTNPELNDIEVEIDWRRNVSNHKNNLFLSGIFYILIILYINPITTDKYIISRNNMC